MTGGAGSTLLVADEAIASVEKRASPLPGDWGAKALYLGETGARNWLDVVHMASGSVCGDPDELQSRRLAAIREVRASTYVSLGPGDGLHDIGIVGALKAGSADLRYIPVDISSGLLDAAIRNVSGHAPIPVAIQCDFEAAQHFLRGVLVQHARPPLLVTLLGGTVGNLDLGEARFFAGIRELMGPDDSFLVEIPLAGPAWTADNEPRMKAAHYSTSFRRFLLSGLSPAPAPAGGEGTAKDFEARIELALEDGDVPGSKTIIARDRRDGRTIRNCRYRWAPALAWLRDQGWLINYQYSTITSDQDILGMGWVLLAR